MVVCDIDPDLEGEDGGGSIDVEERNVMARTAASRADVVFAVGGPSLKGVHALVRVIADLVAFGVPAHRIVPVINRSPRSHRARAGLGTAVAELAGAATGGRLASPVHLPERATSRATSTTAAACPPASARRWRARSRPCSTGSSERTSDDGAGAAGGGERIRPGSLGRVDRRRGRRLMDRSELSPLQEIERRVQERARDLALDMAGDDGTAQLRALDRRRGGGLVRRLQAGPAGLRPGRPRRSSPTGPSATSPATARSSRSWPTTTSGRS